MHQWRLFRQNFENITLTVHYAVRTRNGCFSHAIQFVSKSTHTVIDSLAYILLTFLVNQNENQVFIEHKHIKKLSFLNSVKQYFSTLALLGRPTHTRARFIFIACIGHYYFKLTRGTPGLRVLDFPTLTTLPFNK